MDSQKLSPKRPFNITYRLPDDGIKSLSIETALPGGSVGIVQSDMLFVPGAVTMPLRFRDPGKPKSPRPNSFHCICGQACHRRFNLDTQYYIFGFQHVQSTGIKYTNWSHFPASLVLLFPESSVVWHSVCHGAKDRSTPEGIGQFDAKRSARLTLIRHTGWTNMRTHRWDASDSMSCRCEENKENKETSLSLDYACVPATDSKYEMKNTVLSPAVTSSTPGCFDSDSLML
jgi:hypothetical protein